MNEEDFSLEELRGHQEDYREEERKLRREYRLMRGANEPGGPTIHRCQYCSDHPIMDEIETNVLECPECGYEEFV